MKLEQEEGREGQHNSHHELFEAVVSHRRTDQCNRGYPAQDREEGVGNQALVGFERLFEVEEFRRPLRTLVEIAVVGAWPLVPFHDSIVSKSGCSVKNDGRRHLDAIVTEVGRGWFGPEAATSLDSLEQNAR